MSGCLRCGRGSSWSIPGRPDHTPANPLPMRSIRQAQHFTRGDLVAPLLPGFLFLHSPSKPPLPPLASHLFFYFFSFSNPHLKRQCNGFYIINFLSSYFFLQSRQSQRDSQQLSIWARSRMKNLDWSQLHLQCLRGAEPSQTFTTDVWTLNLPLLILCKSAPSVLCVCVSESLCANICLSVYMFQWQLPKQGNFLLHTHSGLWDHDARQCHAGSISQEPRTHWAK